MIRLAIPSLGLLVLAAPAGAQALPCRFDTVCEIGGACNSDGVDMTLVLSVSDGMPSISVADEPFQPALPVTKGELRSFIVARHDALDVLTIAADGTAQLVVLYGGPGDFAYRGTCGG